MDFAWIVAEDKIKTSMKNGDFDHLPGKGKPQKLEDLSMIPEDLRIAYKILKNSGNLPEDNGLQKELMSLEELLKYCESEKEREEVKRQISAKKLRYEQLAQERQSRIAPEYRLQVQRKLTES